MFYIKGRQQQICRMGASGLRRVQFDGLDDICVMQIDNQTLSDDLLDYTGFLVVIISLFTLSLMGPPLVETTETTFFLTENRTAVITCSLANLVPAGFTDHRRVKTSYLVVHERKIRTALVFQEIWEGGLSDRKPIAEAEQSEVGTVEPRILPNQIQEAIKDTWYLANNHHYTALFDENRT
jgi:hypothetical protein